MLVVTRRTDEAVIITNDQTGEQITVRLLSCKSGRSRIGLEAPDNYRIDREEVLAQNTLAEMQTGG